MEELALLFRKTADLIDEMIAQEKVDTTKEQEQDLLDRFLLNLMKIQRSVDSL